MCLNITKAIAWFLTWLARPQVDKYHFSRTRACSASRSHLGFAPAPGPAPAVMFVLTLHVTAELKAQADYNPRERRALTVRGGGDSVGIPAWLSGSHAAGRGGGSECSWGRPGKCWDLSASFASRPEQRYMYWVAATSWQNGGATSSSQ